ncbi:MAG: hypothetical protein GDA49_14180 [Rhodospirillales bacterium]|nr:hypothetical protein [Rhodospirillales bacterium]
MEDHTSRRTRLQPVALAIQAYALTFRQSETVLRFSWVAVLALVVLGRIVSLDAPEVSLESAEQQVAPGFVATVMLLALGAGLVHAMVGVAWHRAILLGETFADRRAYLRFGPRECLYGVTGVFFAMCLIMGLSLAPVALSQGGGGGFQLFAVIVAPVAATLIVARSMLVFPSIALGKGPDLAMSWQATQGNGFTAAAALFLVLGPIIVFEFLMIGIVTSIVAANYGMLIELVVSFVSTTVLILLFSVVVALMSLVYRQLVDPASDDTPGNPGAW